jgi:hypothetical protein
MTEPPGPKVLPAVAAGIISAVVVLSLAYAGGVVVIAVQSQDLLTTLLAAVTVLLLAIILIFLPNMLVGVLVGLLLGLGSRLASRPLGLIAGALIGFALAETVFSFAIPWVVPPQPDGDFVTIISNRYLTGAYGLLLGSLTGLLFRRLSRGG